jgi:hypothetical protein
MSEDLRMVSYMLRHDPLVIAGLVLIGIAAILSIRMQLKMVKAGHKFPFASYLTKRSWGLPMQYLKARAEHGWSPWPAYLVLPTGVIGAVCLIIGLFRL